MFKRPISLIILTLFGFMYADVFMTELADPNNSSSAGRYVELYNNGSEDVDLSSGWALQRWTNGNADPQTAKSLTGTISAGGFYVICNDGGKFLSTYGFDCDQDIGTGGPADSNGDDNMALLDASGAIVDIYGLPGQDGTISSGGTSEFEDGRAERADGTCSGSETFDAANWNIDHDSGGGDGAQNAPEGFDPGAWIGSAFDCGGGGVVTCDDDTACNFGEEGSCTYPSGCDEQCGSTAVIDDCGECGGSNACFLAVTFNVNMAAETVDTEGYGLSVYLDGYNDMSDADGDGVWSATLQLAGNTSYSYKFKNGNNWEVNFNDLGCGDGDTYGNRTFDLGDSDLDLPAVCFNSCEDCPQDIPGCIDDTALNYDDNATVDDGSCVYSYPDPDNLFFSEYAEGSSNHKYLEIYNGSDGDVDLSGYSLSSCSNGCDTPWDYTDNVTFESGTVVAAGDVYVVCHGSADDMIQAECDQTFTYLSNGDDAFGLTQVGSGAILDIIGAIGPDPGSGWDVAGVSSATKDHTLVRDASVNSGNGGDWALSAGTTADDSEWIVFEKDTWAYVGSHPHDFAVLCDDAAACNNGEEGDCTYADEGFNCNGDPLFSVTFQVDMSDQVVDTEGYGLDLYVDDPYGYHDMTDDDGDGVWSVTLVLEGYTSYAYKFKNGNAWENNFNDLGCGAGDTYGNRTFTLMDSDTTLPAVCFNSCTECEDPCDPGDVNNDDIIDVLDVVAIVDTILDWDLPTLDCSDYNGDGDVSVIDVVQMVDLILGGRAVDATESKLIINDSLFSITSDGFIGAVQMTLNHSEDFNIDFMGDALIADYNTTNNSTVVIVVAPNEGDLFSISGEYEISDIVVANSDSYIECEVVVIETIADKVEDIVDVAQIKSSKLNAAYPNPFNPVVQMDLDISETANVTINIYNITGQLVGEIVQGVMDYGTHRLSWDAGNLPSGIYYIHTNIAGDISTQKVMLLK